MRLYELPVNPIDDAATFVRQHYLDFLGREPDQAGADYWTAQITQCGTNLSCLNAQRIGVSASFFIELEFQQTGSVVYRMNRAAFGTMNNAGIIARLYYTQFRDDRAQLVGGAGFYSKARSTTPIALRRAVCFDLNIRTCSSIVISLTSYSSRPT